MSRFYQFVIFALSLAFCVLGSAGARAVAVWPDGVGANGVVNGVYPGSDAGSCCWTARTARVRLQIPAGADTLVVRIFIPPYAVRGQTQSLRMVIGGQAPQQRCCFGAGMHELAFTLGAPRKSERVVNVAFALRRTFIPNQAGVGGDPRALGVLLRGVSFVNAETGMRFGEGAVAQSHPALRLALLLLAALAIGLATYRRPIAGLAAMIVTDAFFFGVDVHGTTITLPKAVLVAAGVALLLRGGFAGTLRGRALWMLGGAHLLFAGSVIVSSAHAGSHAAALHESLKAFEYLMTLAVGYAAYRLEPDETALRLTVAGTTLLVALLACVQEFSTAPQAAFVAGHAISRIAGPLDGPNQLAAFLGIAVPVMLAFALTRAPLLLERIALFAGAIACLLTLSRGGIAALAFGCAVMLALRYRAQSSRAIGIATAGVFAIVLAFAFGEFAGVLHGGATKLFGISGDAYNGGLGSRPDLWHAAYAMWRAHPLFGVGPGNFELLVGRFDPGVHTHANSVYFQTLAEQGLFGFLTLFAVIAASIAAFARRLRDPIALGACGAAVVLAFHQIVDCLWLYPKVGVFWWIVLAAGAACVDAARQDSKAETAADFTPASSSCSIA